jgi:hypothetical protein
MLYPLTCFFVQDEKCVVCKAHNSQVLIVRPSDPRSFAELANKETWNFGVASSALVKVRRVWEVKKQENYQVFRDFFSVKRVF